MKKKMNISILRSVKGKLITLGLVSIATTVILGITGISVLNSNNANNQVLADVNNINLLQNNNTTEETAFLYDLDLSHYETIQSNLASMKAASEDALKYSDSSELTSIDTDISALTENIASLTSHLSERSFDSSAGMYAEFTNYDSQCSAAFSLMTGEADWVDGVWSEVPMDTMETITINNTTYRKFTYETDIPASGKRNYLIIRAGNNGILYTGHVYINNIVLDGTEVVDIGSIGDDALAKSYGEGFTDLSITDFNDERSLTYTGTFTDTNPNWQEASIQVPIATYPMESSKKLSYDIYFEETELPVIKLAVAFNEKYNFTENLSSANKMFTEYNKLIAEGTEASSLASEITTLLEEIKTNISSYTVNEDAITDGTNAISGKEEALKSIIAYDTEILNLKTDNNNY